MEQNNQDLTWKSNFYQSTEKCAIRKTDHEIVITSAITGHYEDIHYQADYRITLTPGWNVNSCDITYILNGTKHSVSASRNQDNWIVNGEVRKEFKNCRDIDITLTPFTNTLPINRLELQRNTPRQIEVLYIDVLENTIRVARQQYTKKSDTEFNFQNVPNDFEADITVDNEGFVVHYPELFDRVKA